MVVPSVVDLEPHLILSEISSVIILVVVMEGLFIPTVIQIQSSLTIQL